MKLKVGDKVRVIDSGKQYATYTRFYERYKTETTNPFVYDKRVCDGEIGVVKCIAPHEDRSAGLVIINTKYNAYVIGVRGLEFISRDDMTEREKEI